MNSIKKLVAIISLICVFIFGSACATMSGGSGTSAGSEEGTLSVWTVAPLRGDYNTVLKTDSDNQQALFTKYVVDTFQEEHNCEVKLYNKGWGDTLNESVNRAIAGNTLPDMLCAEFYMPEYIRGGHFEAVDLGELEDHLLASGLEYGSLDGKLYGVPAWTGSFALVINKNVLKDTKVLNEDDTVNATWQAQYEGIDPLAPKTWEELLEICTYIKEYYTDIKDYRKGGMLVSNTKEGSAWRALAYMQTAGGSFVDDEGEIVMNTPENQKAFEMMRKLVKTSPEGAVTSANEDLLWDYFFNNRAAYIVEGIDAVTRTVNFANISEEDVVTCELPVFKDGGVKSNMMVGTGYYGICTTSKNKDLALEFIKFLLSDEIQLKMVEADMRVPVVDTVLNGEEIKTLDCYENMQTFLAPFVDDTYKMTSGLPSFSNNPAQIWEKWYSFSTDLLKTDESISEILQTAQQEMSDALHRD